MPCIECNSTLLQPVLDERKLKYHRDGRLQKVLESTISMETGNHSVYQRSAHPNPCTYERHTQRKNTKNPHIRHVLDIWDVAKSKSAMPCIFWFDLEICGLFYSCTIYSYFLNDAQLVIMEFINVIRPHDNYNTTMLLRVMSIYFIRYYLI